MLFNSIQFLIFFPIVVAAYFALPPRFRWMLLLAASYYFYACWRVEYLSLIIISTLVDYFAAIGIEKATSGARKKLLLGVSLFVNLGFLFVFKYYGFFAGSLQGVLASLDINVSLPVLNVLLPVGISFYTFQTLSYTIDVYRGARGAERHLGIFAVYVAFFPQLVAGPIERSTQLLPQFFKTQHWSNDRALAGLRLMLWGYVKKVVIADRLALYVDPVYANPDQYPGPFLALASLLFAFQIYCDFSGYSDIAIGTARIMGYDLMTNFRQPYFSRSIREFWQRWHISLSTWFRDYVYIPLGGNRGSRLMNFRNLIATFVLSGMWHGANWTFILWGLLHGLYLASSILTRPLRDRIRTTLHMDRVPWLLVTWQTVATFVLVLIGWVFFRAASIGDAFAILGRIITEPGLPDLTTPLIAPFDAPRDVAFILLMLLGLNVCDWFLWKGLRMPGGKWGLVVGISLQIWIIVVFGVFDRMEFIYFQF